MSKLFAVILTVIALLSAIPIVIHRWYGSGISLAPLEDISTQAGSV